MPAKTPLRAAQDFKAHSPASRLVRHGGGRGLQTRQQEPLVQVFTQAFGFLQPHALQVLGKCRGLRCVECRLAQLEDLAELELALEPVQRPQQIALLGAEITAQRILREQVAMTRLNVLQTLWAVVGKTRLQTKVLRQLAGFLCLLDQSGLEA